MEFDIRDFLEQTSLAAFYLYKKVIENKSEQSLSTYCFDIQKVLYYFLKFTNKNNEFYNYSIRSNIVSSFQTSSNSNILGKQYQRAQYDRDNHISTIQINPLIEYSFGDKRLTHSIIGPLKSFNDTLQLQLIPLTNGKI